MSAHGSLTEGSVSEPRLTHDRKGREGKGIGSGMDVGHSCFPSHWWTVFAAGLRAELVEVA